MTATIEKPEKADFPTLDSRYKKMVFAAARGERDGEPDAQTLTDAMKFPSDYEADVDRLRQRLWAAETLRVEVPKLEAEARRLKEEAKPECIGKRPVVEFPSIGQLAAALARFACSKNPQAVSEEKLAGYRAETTARATRGEALRILNSTADPQIEPEMSDLARQIDNIRSRVESRRELTTLENSIIRQTKLAEQLAAGKRPAKCYAFGDFRPIKQLWHDCKQELRHLIKLRPAADQARAENERAAREIAKLQKRIGDLNATKLVAENMVWSE